MEKLSKQIMHLSKEENEEIYYKKKKMEHDITTTSTGELDEETKDCKVAI